jgi:hypothetical protein
VNQAKFHVGVPQRIERRRGAHVEYIHAFVSARYVFRLRIPVCRPVSD